MEHLLWIDELILQGKREYFDFVRQIKNDKTMKKKIKRAILRYLGAIRKKENFYGVVLIEYVWDVVRTDCYGDTILRYMRELRSDGEINYKVIDPNKSIYVKL